MPEVDQAADRLPQDEQVGEADRCSRDQRGRGA
jgi:hypothetical protein